MKRSLDPLLRIAIFYDGQYFFNVSNYYAYQHERKSRISVKGLHAFVKKEASLLTGVDEKLCQIVDAHYFRGRLSAKDANNQNKLYQERVFEDILMGENIVSHYMPLRRTNEGSRQEKGIDVWLALEAFELAIHNRIDMLALVAADGDYVPLVHKCNALGIRVMLLNWEFKFKDENGADRETKTAQSLKEAVLYQVAMQDIIERPGRGQETIVNSLFVSSGEEQTKANGTSKQTKTQATTAGKRRRLKANEKKSEVISLFNGYGFIKDPPDNIFFHYTSLENKDFNELKVGEKVRFTTKTLPEGKRQAERVWVID